jgi:DsbC/DsbD-like thiol-disulfide interchange protein
MKRRRSAAISLLLALTPPQATPALAASSDWFGTEGGRLRLVTRDAAAGGVLEGMLEIELEPGWKTYWRDPGEAGVPPVIDVTGSAGIEAVTILYPAPQWIDDGYSTYAAYPRSVALPLRFAVPGDGTKWHLNAMVFVGVCQKVCIPVQGKAAIGPRDGATADDAIDAAFAALPLEAAAGLTVTSIEDNGSALIAAVELPSVAREAALFVAGNGGWVFGAPRRKGSAIFEIPVLARPQSKAEARFEYTLTAGAMAASGTAVLPAD